jgi:hypothetical protein
VVFACGGFTLVGLLCLGAAVVAALVIGAKVRGMGALRAHVAEGIRSQDTRSLAEHRT